jgi:hypothetical protein
MTRTAAVRAGRRHALVERMGIFVRVVDANGFSRAADTLELPRGSVSNCAVRRTLRNPLSGT